MAVYEDEAILSALGKVAALVETRRYFDALKLIRTLLPIEDKLLSTAAPPVLAAAS